MHPVSRLAGALLLATLSLPAAMAFAPDVSQLDAVPLHMVRAPLAKRIETAQSKSQPYQFAVRAALPLDLSAGLWDRLDAETLRWRTQIASPGAQTLNFEFAAFRLPPGAELWIYDRAGALAQGPFTHANETPEGKLWTPVVLGDQAVIELRVAESLRDQVRLDLGAVNHGFRGFGKDDAAIGAKSASCNVDVVCPEGDPWRSEIRSVARISVAGIDLCSGELLNNVRQNDEPLFVTANHCQIGQQQNTPASSVVFYWNYQTSSCGGARNGSLAQTQTGSTLLAGDVTYDFSLLRLSQRPVAHDPSPYFAGWNANAVTPHSGVSIHHPSGDEKALSLYNTDASRDDGECIEREGSTCTRSVNAWGVDWAQGTTEFGSSGGGLWDQDHFVVGWLSGGPTEQCETGPDEYARMDGAFTAGPQRRQQLKAWLDPDGTNAKSLAGRDLGPLLALNDSFSVAANSAAADFSVLGNDPGSGLTLIAVGPTDQGGSVSIAGTQIRYQPANGFGGTETFSYTVSDGQGHKNSATVSVNVTGAPPPPPPDTGGGGGGAVAPSLLLLMLAAISRRRLRRR